MRGGYLAPRHTEEEKQWAKEKISQLGNRITTKILTSSDLLKEYKERFGRELGLSGMYNWLRIIQDPSRRKKSKPKNVSQENKVFGAKYILYANHNVCGFETLEEMKEFLKENLILGGVHLYEKKSLNISYDIKLE